MILLLDVEGHVERPRLLEEVRTVRCSHGIGLGTLPILRHKVRSSLVHVYVLRFLRLSLMIFGLQSVLGVKHKLHLLRGDIHGQDLLSILMRLLLIHANVDEGLDLGGDLLRLLTVFVISKRVWMMMNLVVRLVGAWEWSFYCVGRRRLVR